MNRKRPMLIPNVSLVPRDGETGDVRTNDPQPVVEFALTPLAQTTNSNIIEPYVNHWSVRAVANIKKTPTEEERELEKMVFQCLWNMRVKSQLEEQYT